jgi:hypothetical protein
MSSNVSACTQTVDLAVDRRLTDSERKVFSVYARKYVEFFRNEWTGWKYDGRPPDAPRNVSLSAWKSRIQTTEGRAVMTIVNEAKDYRYGRDYVAMIHRAGQKAIEWKIVAANADIALLPSLVGDMAKEIAKNAALPADPKRLQARGGGVTVRAAGAVF